MVVVALSLDATLDAQSASASGSASPSSGIAGDSTEDAVLAPWWSLALIPIGTVFIVVAATSLPARLATRSHAADALLYE